MLNLPVKQRQPLVEWWMIAALAGLMIIGAAFIASATLAKDVSDTAAWYQREHVKQIVWYLVGGGLAAATCVVDYRRLARWSTVVYWLAMVSLVAVLSPMIGTTHGWGARRWIDLGAFQFQPSEFAKLAFIMMLASYLSRPEGELRDRGLFLRSLGLALLPFVLILKEPDLGSALVFLPVGLVMMFVAGVPTRLLVQFVGGVGLVVVLLLVDILFAPPQWQLKLEPYQRRRLLVYFGVTSVSSQATEAERRRALKEYRDASYNVEQALISVGSGGLTGKGWRQGTQNALGYLPRAVAHNDFIFSVIAEESGFVGSVTVVALYTVILFSGIKIAGQARDRLGRLLAVGVVSLLF
ncbi:MAG: FtsW/RodA/SpoVE family cell cycle protein, partial [Limisphaerales bacterium]